ncbi:MAG: PEGA domain-containing protein [Chloroflexi bacterium]|nr:PEGA domain-containing protein [Chloroflexota bacterium]
MQLPFSIAVEAPGRAQLRRAARKPWVWIAGIVVIAGVAVAVAAYVQFRRTEAVGEATLRVTSDPSGASVDIGDRKLGRTPAALRLGAADHRVTLHRDGYEDAIRSVSLTFGGESELHADLWRWTPEVQQLRPTFPGATIAGADFLADGRIALAIALPPDDERQTWLLDEDGGMRRLGPTEARGALAVTPDGRRIAYVARGQGDDANTSGVQPDEVWVAPSERERGTRSYVLTTEMRDERLVDLSWAPDGQHLFLVTRYQLVGGGYRTRLLWLDTAHGAVDKIANIPSEVVPGSYSWSPTGEHVSFLAQSGQTTSLCLVRTDGSELRYLTDLYQDDSNPLAFPPVAWSSDGSRMLYAAPTQNQGANQSGWLWGVQSAPALFEVRVSRPQEQRVGTAEGQSPSWREDGSIVMLARPKLGGPLALRSVEADGSIRDLGDLPFKAGPTYAARWDVAHAQAIVAVRGAASTGANKPEYWLVRYRPEADR